MKKKAEKIHEEINPPKNKRKTSENEWRASSTHPKRFISEYDFLAIIFNNISETTS